MKKISDELEILFENFGIKDKVIIDIGCGAGKVTRRIAECGGIVKGIDCKAMIEKAITYNKVSNEEYIIGFGEQLPFPDEFADLVFYCASFHHIPVDGMRNAIKECRRVLKTGGRSCFIEPVSLKNTYCELTKLVSDETDIQRAAYKFISGVVKYGFKSECETLYYLERTYNDYENLLRIYVDEEKRREKLLKHARIVLSSFNLNYESVILPSVVRVNIYQKN